MSKPTYNDADIMLKFVQWGAALKIEILELDMERKVYR